MSTKAASGASAWVDPDDAPPLDDAFFEAAEVREGARLVRPGRPKLDQPKLQVTLRLDRDLVDHFRSGGPGWQTRLNERLRQAVKADGPRR
ncbi:MAG: BrnA antitoxin family protein [Caulobacteraceae bacterium]|jgi:uncharacterized protein (DUF4415 family)